MTKALLFLTLTLSLFAQDLTLNNTPAQVYFSPKGGVTAAVVRELDGAKSEILVQAYSFTSAPVSKALLDAAHRGVKIIAVLDKSNVRAKYTAADTLAKRGIPVFIDDKHQIAHNKIIIIDRQTVITGSFNFSKAAEESNAENLLILKNKELATVYMRNFVEHREHSVEYKSK